MPSIYLDESVKISGVIRSHGGWIGFNGCPIWRESCDRFAEGRLEPGVSGGTVGDVNRLESSGFTWVKWSYSSVGESESESESVSESKSESESESESESVSVSVSVSRLVSVSSLSVSGGGHATSSRARSERRTGTPKRSSP